MSKFTNVLIAKYISFDFTINFANYWYRFAHTYGIFLLLLKFQKSLPILLYRRRLRIEVQSLPRVPKSKGEARRHWARVSEERPTRDRLLAVTELHLFGPPSKKVIFFQGGNFQTPTVTAFCRKRAALCPRLLAPFSRPPRFASLSLSFSRFCREYKHFATGPEGRSLVWTGRGVGGEEGIYSSSASRAPIRRRRRMRARKARTSTVTYWLTNRWPISSQVYRGTWERTRKFVWPPQNFLQDTKNRSLI